MKKMYLSDLNQLNDYEKEHKRISYRRLINRYVDNKILCNNPVVSRNESFEANLYDVLYELFNDLDDETKEEYNDDYLEYFEGLDIFQYYITDCNEYEASKLKEAGELIVYHNDLDCYILCVTHWGTSWEYVLTGIEYTLNHKESDF